jgi:trypsin
MRNRYNRPSWLLVLWGAAIWVWPQACRSQTSVVSPSGADQAVGEEEDQSHIVGGATITDSSKYPYYAIPQGGTLCGAVLVHEDILATAAHCQGVWANQDIYLGTTWFRGDDAKEKLRTTIEKPHPQFNEISMEYDIMLVKLATKSNLTPVAFTGAISVPATGGTGTVIGFGHTKFQGAVSQRLQEIKIDVLEHAKCEAGYGLMNATLQFCAGNTGRDSCNGDSGGPMISPGGVLIGIVSFGFQCGSEGFPGVYTRVGAVDDFINSNICSMSSNPPSRCSNECIKESNRCSGLFTKKGFRMRKFDGNKSNSNCVETCASFFSSLLRSSGWKCGRCP